MELAYSKEKFNPNNKSDTHIQDWRCMYRASYCDVLMANEMHNSYNQFFIPQFFVCSTCFERVRSTARSHAPDD